MIFDQITGIIAEKILNVFYFTECNRIYPPLYTVFSISSPATVPLFVCRNGKKSVLPVFVILGIKIECPVYLYYNIAKIFTELLILLPETLHSCVFVTAT